MTDYNTEFDDLSGFERDAVVPDGVEDDPLAERRRLLGEQKAHGGLLGQLASELLVAMDEREAKAKADAEAEDLALKAEDGVASPEELAQVVRAAMAKRRVDDVERVIAGTVELMTEAGDGEEDIAREVARLRADAAVLADYENGSSAESVRARMAAEGRSEADLARFDYEVAAGKTGFLEGSDPLFDSEQVQQAAFNAESRRRAVALAEEMTSSTEKDLAEAQEYVDQTLASVIASAKSGD